MTQKAAKSLAGYRESGRESPHVTLESFARRDTQSTESLNFLWPRRWERDASQYGATPIEFLSYRWFRGAVPKGAHKVLVIYFESYPVVCN